MINKQQSTKEEGENWVKYNNYCGLSWPPPTDIRSNNQPDQQSNKYERMRLAGDEGYTKKCKTTTEGVDDAELSCCAACVY